MKKAEAARVKAHVARYWRESTDRYMADVLGLEVCTVKKIRQRLGLKKKHAGGAEQSMTHYALYWRARRKLKQERPLTDAEQSAFDKGTRWPEYRREYLERRMARLARKR